MTRRTFAMAVNAGLASGWAQGIQQPPPKSGADQGRSRDGQLVQDKTDQRTAPVADTAIEFVEFPDHSGFRLQVKTAIRCDVILATVSYHIRPGQILQAEGRASWIAADVTTDVNPGFLFPRAAVESVELTFLSIRTTRKF